MMLPQSPETVVAASRSVHFRRRINYCNTDVYGDWKSFRKKLAWSVSISRLAIRRLDESQKRRPEKCGLPHGPLIQNQKYGDPTMRVIVFVKASKDSEAGVMPSEQLLREMGNFNEELVKAGVMLAGEGLHPSSKGKRILFSGSKRTVKDGPFSETKELVAGYWLWQVRSMEEAVEWVKRCPNPMMEDSEIEIRPVFEAEDFGAEFTPELRAQEERLIKEMAAKNK
jgi:hypothetical protein